ncbi:SmdB family multidrug efflux ABC transporter permease/ATP-binding protein [Buchnera aphidicola]|uniref:Multidrug resistance-like ATP-binding protein MdlB n=1 Tax=Buchnera aphidicola subsp. Melaphis rhois TaxID=118103 RepID=A0A4D6YAN8_BUCMH|nr:SmdB family multidrug efflux ABC transporter permease/ATP-binding protein [Buchnera aphidicola]QCI23441.1 SmdB family multidrug efflux ABC transporter permease/ATP-binding protein [Buchnera aphidicola (Melaphis rhois)]
MKHLIHFWPILKRLLCYGKNYKKHLILGFVCLLLASIFEVLGPVLISYFIQNSLVTHQMHISVLLMTIVIYILLQIISSIFNYLQDIIFNKISIKIIEKLRFNVMSSTLDLPINKFNQQPAGQLISCVTNDTEVIKELYETFISTLFRSIILISVTLITMFTLEWRMASIAITMFPLVLIITLSYQYYSKPILKKVRKYVTKIYNIFNEVINGINVIQQFGLETKFKNSIENTSKLHYLARMNILKLDALLLRPLLNLFSTIILCGLILLFGLYPKGFFEIGTLYAFITYLGRLNEPLITIASQQSILQQAIVSGERIFELIDTTKQKYGTDTVNLKTGEIYINNLNFCYDNNCKNTLNNINLNISSKKFIALVGHTGSGKSTLAQLLMGYYPIKNGSIYLDRRNINTLSKKVLRNGISIVQQDPIILDDSILENITVGRKIPKSDVWNILNKVHLIKLVKSMPKGIYSILGENGNILSVGQKQLLSIARVLISNPKILILDEATANIDLETEKKIQIILSSIKNHTTLIVIAHRLSTVKNADEIVVFHHGKIVEQGTHDNLIQNKKFYWKIYNSQNDNNSGI